MRLLLLAATFALALALPDEYKADGDVTCKLLSDCPAIPCHTAKKCEDNRCEYEQHKPKSLCPGQSCSNKGKCDDDVNDYCNDKGVCVDAFHKKGHVCASDNNPCTKDATCDGECGKCPAIEPEPSTKKCTGESNSGKCDDEDFCDGKGKCVDHFKVKGHVCASDKNPCTKDSECDGKTGVCPVIQPEPSTKKCTGESNSGKCDDEDFCDGKGKCVDRFKKKGHVCDKSENECVKDGVCDGECGSCSPKSFENDKKKCCGKNNKGACDDDDEDHCDGKGKCVDVYFQKDVLCRKGATLCDANVFCTGKQSKCPAPTNHYSYGDSASVTYATYLSDTVAQCSAVGSEQLMAVVEGTSNHLVLVFACVAAMAVVASAVAAKKADRLVSMEDGYARLAEDMN